MRATTRWVNTNLLPTGFGEADKSALEIAQAALSYWSEWRGVLEIEVKDEFGRVQFKITGTVDILKEVLGPGR